MKSKVNVKNMFINLVLHVLICMLLLASTYWIFIWDANLFNALVAEHERTWREWTLIVGSVFMGSGILLGFTAVLRGAWDGSMFDDQFPPRSKR
jgi:hypothetical protein